jgi:hypothetical protein
MTPWDRMYKVYVVLGDPISIPPWVRATWNQVEMALDPLIRTARGRPAVRSSQHRPVLNLRDLREEHFIRFGRIGWNERGFNKWVHTTNGQLASGDAATFVDTEVWAPSWNECQRHDLPPDAFFFTKEEKSFAMTKPPPKLPFGSTSLLAVACDLGPGIAGQAREGVNALASAVKSVLKGQCVRAWSYDAGGGWRTGAINDLVVGGLFKPGPRDGKPVSLSMLEDRWNPF